MKFNFQGEIFTVPPRLAWSVAKAVENSSSLRIFRSEKPTLSIRPKELKYKTIKNGSSLYIESIEIVGEKDNVDEHPLRPVDDSNNDNTIMDVSDRCILDLPGNLYDDIWGDSALDMVAAASNKKIMYNGKYYMPHLYLLDLPEPGANGGLIGTFYARVRLSAA
ncbi:hypothetical protein [Pseudomonas sp. RIT623]|uniref:hypothetical protein n=1 Tax=Pseudomonas sp. RIT623 TaxID=2559075 RepID=UPI00106FE830|nr:hypothetical protein [Pseudomonas sp. RIT623]TFF37609.1 hypothetical protein E3U47_17610 [Pseudomonas sp. RIT623]